MQEKEYFSILAAGCNSNCTLCIVPSEICDDVNNDGGCVIMLFNLNDVYLFDGAYVGEKIDIQNKDLVIYPYIRIPGYKIITGKMGV